jgi:hypothetical protein
MSPSQHYLRYISLGLSPNFNNQFLKRLLIFKFQQELIFLVPPNIMADHNDNSAQAAKTKASFVHDEERSEDHPDFRVEQIAYERNGIKGILNSPFVCGAALLASFGGFSFGYGKSFTMEYKFPDH